MKWITRSHVHVDRVACRWLISRFLDSAADFLFVPKSQILAVAEEEGAIAYNTPGADLHHRGDLCTVDVLIEEYGLVDKGLLRLAKIVNAADTNNLQNDSMAAGLEAITVGFMESYPVSNTFF